jgi:hypothetical protein
MGARTERSLRRWKWIAVVAIASAGILLAALVVTAVSLLRATHQTDERLSGTWQSDADRTLAALREGRPVEEKQEAALRKLFGKLRVTYTGRTCTTELDGVTESSRYEVLGRDKLSVVIREIETKLSPLEVTEFAVIHFDGPDSYWLYTKIGSIREYFKRVR